MTLKVKTFLLKVLVFTFQSGVESNIIKLFNCYTPYLNLNKMNFKTLIRFPFSLGSLS